MTELPTTPVSLRVHLAHSTLQAIAEECDADVLHIKGPDGDSSPHHATNSSVYADILIPPEHLKRNSPVPPPWDRCSESLFAALRSRLPDTAARVNGSDLEWPGCAISR